MASYGHLKVDDLKKLLRERGASLKGKNKDLVERLKLYNENKVQFLVETRKYAHLLIYTFKDWTIIDAPRNDMFIKKMEDKLTLFYEEYFQPALLEKVLYKNYAKSFYKQP